MKNKTKELNKKRQKRKKNVRAKIKGNKNIPRFSIFRSNKYIYAQLIDDEEKKTICSYSSANLDNKSEISKTKEAEMVGEKLAELAKGKSVKDVVFDRGWYKYHGRVKSLIESFKKHFSSKV